LELNLTPDVESLWFCPSAFPSNRSVLCVKSVKAYTDFAVTQLAVRNKDVAEIVRLVKNGELTSIQKVWALTSAAKLVVASERSRATDML